MRSWLLIGVIGALVLTLIGTGLWLNTQKVQKESVTATTTVRALPRDSGAMLLFTTRDGRVVSVPDFTYLHPSLDIEGRNETYVYVTQDDNAVEMDPRYGIVYGNDGTLTIGLFAEPLGATRLLAETKLRELMEGVPDDILCLLPVSVGVPDTMNSSFVGRELGLSFCPCAVTLP